VTFDARFAIVIFAAFATASIAASLVAGWQWRRAGMPAAPQDRAKFLFHLRLLPLVAALLWSMLATASFFIFEPRNADERIGFLLLGLSVVGAVLIGGAALRLTSIWLRHRTMLREWLRTAEPVTLPGVEIATVALTTSFPVVAVVGVFRPRLVIARVVIDACTPDELAAIIDHERGHIRHRDNARRMLLLGLPDLLAWTRAGREMDAAWHDAAEQVADEAAGTDRGDRGRVALAEALIRVAKLAPAGATLDTLPASALYRGEPLEERVRRLLDPISPRPRAPRRHQWLAVAAFFGLALVLLNPIHELLEAAVTFLP
jgi:Zn-dependent protease with chaperone function